MNDSSSPERRNALAAFLKAKRAAISPERFGLPVHQRRRVAGLRREEVAILCGISTTWYTQLEAGAPITVSPALLRRLAEVLALTALERAYLFALAIDELREIAALLPTAPILGSRIGADSVAVEIAQALQVHRKLKTQIYDALINGSVDTLLPHLDETRCPIGYWLHDDLASERRRDPNYTRAAEVHAAFHREIDRVVHAAIHAGPAHAESMVLAGSYAAASARLEATFGGWSLALAS